MRSPSLRNTLARAVIAALALLLSSLAVPPPMARADAAHDSLVVRTDRGWVRGAARRDGGRPLPVLVWLHGGGNAYGAGSDYDGSMLAARGVVVVTVNYRLGALGFLAHPALLSESEDHASGDYGLVTPPPHE
ncbi:carboxylesterase family protein [Streptomyces sp. NPDC058145]|uniref:carboxylesterase family protein n=1 Tax=Streptomyces sp. NPDC058145 TaxID=3346356 RepID=UPI0036E9D1E4